MSTNSKSWHKTKETCRKTHINIDASQLAFFVGMLFFKNVFSGPKRLSFCRLKSQENFLLWREKKPEAFFWNGTFFFFIQFSRGMESIGKRSAVRICVFHHRGKHRRKKHEFVRYCLRCDTGPQSSAGQ